jgi:dTDP-glucose 4,6-dehydratase
LWSRYAEDEIVVIDLLTYAGNPSTIAGVEWTELIEGNIRDTALVERLLAQHDIATVVHFAAESHVDRSISGPDAFIETNILGTNSLLKAARQVWLETGSGREHRFHHISTDEVYGSLGPNDPALPRGYRLWAQLALFGVESPFRSPRAGVPSHLWAAGVDEQLL